MVEITMVVVKILIELLGRSRSLVKDMSRAVKTKVVDSAAINLLNYYLVHVDAIDVIDLDLLLEGTQKRLIPIPVQFLLLVY